MAWWSSIGPVATLLNTIADWRLGNKYDERKKRKNLENLRKAATNALYRNDWAEHRRIVAELERVSDAP